MTMFSGIRKPISADYFSAPANGEQNNAETRLNRLAGYITPNALFYVRSHAPTPIIDRDQWQLRIEGDGVAQAVCLDYDALAALPQTSLIRAIECAGNARVFFKRQYGREAGNAQWGTGAIGVAEWTGVRLRDVLACADLHPDAVDILPEGLDADTYGRPLPIAKALADDTLVALAMNGEPLPADHGFPARLVVGGWLGAASVKWLGRIEVARRALHNHWNTADYTLAGPDYPAQGPADGQPVTMMPVMSVLELDWNAHLDRGPQIIRGRAFSGEGRVARVEYAIDDGPWRDATLGDINIAAAWVRYSFRWDAPAGSHDIRIRATDEAGQRQPATVPWNTHGLLYNAVIAHPVHIT